MSGSSILYLCQSSTGLLRVTILQGARANHFTSQLCKKCSLALTINSGSGQVWRGLLKLRGRRSPFQRDHRELSTVPPNLDPDIERLQRSMQGMRSTKVEKFDGDRLIYEARAANYLHFVTVAFYATALFGLYAAPDFIVGAWESDKIDTDSVMTLMLLFSGIVVLPVSLRMFARRLILKLYYNEARDTYLAVVSRTVFGVTKKRFSGRDVRSTHEYSMQRILQLTSFKVKGRPFFVNSSLFKLPSDYNRLMRFV